ncbi:MULTISPECIES: sigma factor-like helix-turn-helix DNA-binding protein [Nitrospirillum]|uniref:DNA-directed RNA polymerase specialized sigma24 family protein n=1 Tax=Nitrospirillum amazonense TaxID=28077 RepID=A0A560FJA0_9PROT|nr:sigma factor-like helix-turn-helix DNA-binding protein [Nitrospirillum amazonense]MEC4592322.1 sigma factor-like helix-turn-helix DNA-binding protein [Nitrospirillum amazonense]TWB21679.1 DNA-directed RNA polymerase specialized sigma24 family protein [Nitrospirillum amazonense]
MPAHRSAPADLITEQLPCLRRYARALTGSAISGDAYVRMVLETLVQDGVGILGPDADRGTLFRLFHRIYAGGHLELGDEGPVPETMGPGALLRTLPCERREALLLTAVEGFTADEAAWILGLPLDEVEHQTKLARQAFREGLQSGVLMLEDDLTIRLPQAGDMPPHAHAPLRHPADARPGGWGASLQ